MTITALAPDLILHSGQIYTMDAQNSVVEAVAIKDSRILTTGGTAQLRALAVCRREPTIGFLCEN